MYNANNYVLSYKMIYSTFITAMKQFITCEMYAHWANM